MHPTTDAPPTPGAVELKKFKRHRSHAEVKALCKAQGLDMSDGLYKKLDSDYIVVESPVFGRALFNVVNGRFFGNTPDGKPFHSDSAKHDAEPWFRQMLDLFYGDEVVPA